MSTNDRWSALSMKDKADLIKLMVENGVTSLDDMKLYYNGGEKPTVERKQYDGKDITLETYKQLQRDKVINSAVQKALTREEASIPTINGVPQRSCIYTATDNFGNKYKVMGNQTFMANPQKYGFTFAGPLSDNPDENIGRLYQFIDAKKVPHHIAIITGKDEKGEPLISYSKGNVTLGKSIEELEKENYVKNNNIWQEPWYETYKFVGTPEDNNAWEAEFSALPNVEMLPAVNNYATKALKKESAHYNGGNLYGGGGEIRQGKPFNAWQRYMSDHPMTRKRLHKASVLGMDLLRVLPWTAFATDVYDLNHAQDDSDKLTTGLSSIGRGGDIILNVVKQAGNDDFPLKNLFRNGTYGKLLSLPDLVDDSRKFIRDFVTPIDKYKSGGKIHIKPENQGFLDEDNNIYWPGGPLKQRQKMYNSVKDRIIQQAQAEQMTAQPKMGEKPLAPLEYDIANYTTGIGDIEFAKDIGEDIANKNFKSAAIGAGLLLLPNFLGRGLKSARKTESVKNAISEARAYKESEQYRDLVKKAKEEAKRDANLNISERTLLDTQPKTDASFTYAARPKDEYAEYQRAAHNIELDPNQIPYKDIEDVAYHEALHSMNVGRPEIEIGENYNKWAEALDNGASDEKQKELWDAFIANKDEYNRFKERSQTTNYLKYKAADAIYPDGGDYLMKLGELQANGMEAGRHLGITPFTEYPGERKARKAITKARRYNPELWNVRGVTSEEVKNFWKILTGQYTPIVGVGLLGAGTTLSENNN